MPVGALYNFRKLTTLAYQVGNVPVELTKFAQRDVFSRLLVRIVGTLNTGAGAAGVATGLDNPEGLLKSVILQTSPTIASVVPFNQVSGRGLRWDGALNRGFLINPTAIADGAGAIAVDYTYELVFKRFGVRGAIEYSFDISKFTSALLTLNFGDQTQLFTGSANAWNLNALNIELYADSNFSVDADQLHAHELFEQNFPILQAQSDFPITQLPPGFLYTDFIMIGEDNNAPSNNVINNFDIEGGGRIWLPAGDKNALMVQRALTVPEFDGSVGLANLHGVYIPVSMRDGMFSRQIDALQAPILIKLDVNAPAGHTFNVRLIGRRMLPGAVKQSAKVHAALKRGSAATGSGK